MIGFTQAQVAAHNARIASGKRLVTASDFEAVRTAAARAPKGAPETREAQESRKQGAGTVAGTQGPRRGKQPNRTETEFQQMLAARKNQGEFDRVEWEGVKLRLGENCYYCPDFFCWLDTGSAIKGQTSAAVTCFEVKGAHIWDDSKVKFKAAKERYPWIRFEMWQKQSKKNGGAWRQIL